MMADDGSDQSQGFAGYLSPADASADVGMHDFHHDQAMNFTRTKVLGKIIAVHPNKDNPLLAPTVDWQPLTMQSDGQGQTRSHGVVYGAPVKRHHAGDTAIICDPIKGDVCEFSVHDRDISSTVAAQGEAPAGSSRQFNLADATCHGQVGSKTVPKHFVQFERNDKGEVTSINYTSSAQHNINGVVIDPKGNITAPGFIKAAGEITAGNGTGDSVTLQQHQHKNTQRGAGLSDVPQGGT